MLVHGWLHSMDRGWNERPKLNLCRLLPYFIYELYFHWALLQRVMRLFRCIHDPICIILRGKKEHCISAEYGEDGRKQLIDSVVMFHLSFHERERYQLTVLIYDLQCFSIVSIFRNLLVEVFIWAKLNSSTTLVSKRILWRLKMKLSLWIASIFLVTMLFAIN